MGVWVRVSVSVRVISVRFRVRELGLGLWLGLQCVVLERISQPLPMNASLNVTSVG